MQRRLEQPVLLDVLGELVESHFDGQRNAKTPLDLLVEPDAAPDGVQGLLLPAVPLQQASADGLARVMGECQDDAFEDVGFPFEVKAVPRASSWGPRRRLTRNITRSMGIFGRTTMARPPVRRAPT